jgi:hypothetical protein
MTKEQIACWKLMANSLRNVLPFIEAVAGSQCINHLGDLPYEEMASGLEVVILLEELVRPEQGLHFLN